MNWGTSSSYTVRALINHGFLTISIYSMKRSNVLYSMPRLNWMPTNSSYWRKISRALWIIRHIHSFRKHDWRCTESLVSKQWSSLLIQKLHFIHMKLYIQSNLTLLFLSNENFFIYMALCCLMRMNLIAFFYGALQFVMKNYVEVIPIK